MWEACQERNYSHNKIDTDSLISNQDSQHQVDLQVDTKRNPARQHIIATQQGRE